VDASTPRPWRRKKLFQGDIVEERGEQPGGLRDLRKEGQQRSQGSVIVIKGLTLGGDSIGPCTKKGIGSNGLLKSQGKRTSGGHNILTILRRCLTGRFVSITISILATQ